VRTLDEAIKYEEMIVDACESTARMVSFNDPYEKDLAFENNKCAEKHRQIAEWLKELRTLKAEKGQSDNSLGTDDNTETTTIKISKELQETLELRDTFGKMSKLKLEKSSTVESGDVDKIAVLDLINEVYDSNGFSNYSNYNYLYHQVDKLSTKDRVDKIAVLDLINDLYHESGFVNYSQYDYIYEEVYKLNKTAPLQKWIPISEKLPKLEVNIGTEKNPIMTSKPVFITCRYINGNDYILPVPCILHSSGHWYLAKDLIADWVSLDEYDSEINNPLRLKVIAWTKLRQPYDRKVKVNNSDKS